MIRPPLRQHDKISLTDLTHHPIWVAVYGRDEEESWYEGTDELTFRPRDGPGPFHCSDPDARDAIASAAFRLADGTTLRGFARPPYLSDGSEGQALGYTQPVILFPDNARISFWVGAKQSSENERKACYSLLSKAPEQVFPIEFRIDEGLIDRDFVGSITGFGRIGHNRSLILER